MSGHHRRHCVYCGKQSGDARTCVKHAPLLMLDPYYAPPASFYLERQR